MYADLLQGMKVRAKYKEDTYNSRNDNEVAEAYYGDRYSTIVTDFKLRIHKEL